MQDPTRRRDSSYRPDCPACSAERRHTTGERMRFHPLAGHGFQSGQGWSCAEAERAHLADIEEAKCGK
jgi:hypothetical protein